MKIDAQKGFDKLDFSHVMMNGFQLKYENIILFNLPALAFYT